MRKLFSILLIAALLLCVGSPAYARVGQSRIGLIRLQSTGVITPHTHVRTSPTLIYRINFTATFARVWVVVYDSSTTGSASTMRNYLSSSFIGAENNGRVLVDITEATAGDSKEVTFDPPLEAKNGILVSTGTTNATTGLVEEIGENVSGVPVANVIIHFGE